MNEWIGMECLELNGMEFYHLFLKGIFTFNLFAFLCIIF